jgi:short chain dehydrogenase
MDMLLKGKRALITGSTSGIGAQCARVLAGEGVSVVINGRSADRAAAVTEEILKVGCEAKFFLGDVTTEDGSNAVIEGAKSAFDGIDIHSGYLSSRRLSADLTRIPDAARHHLDRHETCRNRARQSISHHVSHGQFTDHDESDGSFGNLGLISRNRPQPLLWLPATAPL